MTEIKDFFDVISYTGDVLWGFFSIAYLANWTIERTKGKNK